MIASQLNGGLGNQLFQYAVARAVAEKSKVLPTLDLTLLLQQNATHCFYLNQFNIQAHTNAKYLERWWFHHFKKQRLQLISENAMELNRLPKENMFLQGYWQNRFYFDMIKPLLINELTPKRQMEGPYWPQIRSANSVAIHVRRGDYIGSALHEICTDSYFQNAIHWMKSKISNPVFFVFTDDLHYCRNLFRQYDDFIFIEEQNAVRAFWMMKSCTHYILSNSSFGWWAHYLNTQVNGVVSPPRWFNDASINTTGIYFDHWKIIETT